MELIDVYCGVGMASWGLRQAGFVPRFGIEWLPEVCVSYRTNFPGADAYPMNLFLFPLSRAALRYGIDCDFRGLIWISSPCVGFSPASPGGLEDIRNVLLLKAAQEAAHYRDAWIVFENSAGLIRNYSKSFLRGVMIEMEGIDREVKVWHMNALDWGLAQDRERIFIVIAPPGYTCGKQPVGPFKGKRPRTLRDAIHPQSGFQSCDPESVPIWTTELVLNNEIPAGGNWESSSRGQAYAKRKYGNLLRPGKYKRFLRRPSWDEPLGTVTTCCRVGASRLSMVHPEEPRFFNIGELRTLQGVPDEFVLIGDAADKTRDVGNGVPVPLAKAIGEAIMMAAGKKTPSPQPTPETATKLEMW